MLYFVVYFKRFAAHVTIVIMCIWAYSVFAGYKLASGLIRFAAKYARVRISYFCRFVCCFVRISTLSTAKLIVSLVNIKDISALLAHNFNFLAAVGLCLLRHYLSFASYKSQASCKPCTILRYCLAQDKPQSVPPRKCLQL